MSSELKPCPMCGNKAEWKHVRGVLYLRCSQCRLGYDPQDYGGDLGTTEGCWNTRATAQHPAVEALKKARQVINDWIATYAFDMCDTETINAAGDRIMNSGGMLAYTADIIEEIDNALSLTSQTTAETSEKPCTCHPDDKPPVPCPKKYAYSECVKAATPPPVASPAFDGELMPASWYQAELSKCDQQVIELHAAWEKKKAAFEAVTKALRLTLPMAKGYAAQHKVGSNAKYIEYAEEQLALAEQETPAKASLGKVSDDAQTTAMKQHGTPSDAKDGGSLSPAFEAIHEYLSDIKGWTRLMPHGAAELFALIDKALALAEAEMKGER